MTSITTSKPFIQDGMSFYLKTNDDTGVTTINRNNLIPLTQQEIDNAGQEFYDYATSEIQYATLTDGSFGPNWLEKNGGSSDWFNNTYTSEESKRIFEDSFGFTNPNAATTSSESNTNGTLENKDRKTTEVKEAYDKNKLYYPINEEEYEYDYLQITGLEYIPAGNPDSGAFTDQSNIPQELRDNNQSDYTWNDNFLTPISPQKRHQNKKIKGTVRLPMQPGISDSNSVGWSEDKLNAIELAGARLAGSAIGGISSWNLETIGEKWSEISKDFSDDITKQDILTYLAGAAIGKPSELFTRGTGQILNPNLELLFTGPSLRAFNYSFKFTPREPKEADNIKNIILFFKQNMAARTTTGSSFLSTPNVFDIKYIYKNGDQHPFLNKIKTCALKNCDVNYTPDQTYMTYEEGGSMTSYDVRLGFQELEPIYADDYENNNDMGF